MSAHGSNTTIRYVAELTNVKEVSLLGTADLAYWTHRLATDALFPVELDGKAQLLISAVSSKFRGIAFRELSISVVVRLIGGSSDQDGFYLAHAFNSSRLFAFAERAFFSTPYDYATIHVNVSPHPSFTVIADEEVALHAAMSPDDLATQKREPSQSGDHEFQGSVFLPGNGRGASSSGKMFCAKIGGRARTYPFNPVRDVLTLETSKRRPIVRSLIESHFAGKEWVIRENGTHAKSRTFRDMPTHGRIISTHGHLDLP